ncbi:MAG: ribonuclease HI [Parvularculales bacterium]
MTDVIMHTDGACSGNPGPGGWGVVMEHKKHCRELSGGEKETTNNRMELMAAICGLETLKHPCAVILVTDSEYLRNGITRWITNWKHNNWRTASKKPVKNKDLWQRLEAALAPHDVDWRWVRGHTGDPGNERADSLAHQAMEPFMEESK